MKTFFLLLTLIRVDGVVIHHAVDTGLTYEDCIQREVEVRDRIDAILGDSYTLTCEEDHAN